MTLRANHIDRAWVKIGMVITNTGDKHARFYEGGKLILTTMRSFGSRKLDGIIQHKIRQQMKLNERQFADLIDCPLKRDGYVEILKGKGLISD